MTTASSSICNNCSGTLKYDIESEQLKCIQCGSKQAIPESEDASYLKENSFDSFESEILNDQIEAHLISCQSCGAEVEIHTEQPTASCAFCSTPYILDQVKDSRVHKPAALLPFAIKQSGARTAFSEWIDGLWFAPNDLKNFKSSLDKLQGVYYPYWTYDCETSSDYVGSRGDHYYLTETYNTTDSDGNSVRKTRQVQKTRWTRVSGFVSTSFDDILIPAHNSLDRDKLTELEPWDLEALKPYSDEFLRGFNVLNYEVSMRDGFTQFAMPQINEAIAQHIRRDIGGDVQRINHTDTDLSQQTFKHLLLPVWVSAYHYNSKVYHLTINARTGEVQGFRPYSWIKIALASLAVVLVMALIVGGVYYKNHYM